MLLGYLYSSPMWIAVTGVLVPPSMSRVYLIGFNLESIAKLQALIRINAQKAIA